MDLITWSVIAGIWITAICSGLSLRVLISYFRFHKKVFKQHKVWIDEYFDTIFDNKKKVSNFLYDLTLDESKNNGNATKNIKTKIEK